MLEHVFTNILLLFSAIYGDIKRALGATGGVEISK